MGEGRVISRKQSIRFGLILLVLLLIEAVLTLTPNGLAITGHEGDLLHMLDASLRIVAGELPHLDFMTPIGYLGFAPVAFWLSLGFMVGKATLLANLSLSALLLPVIWWVGATRFSFAQALTFGVFILMTMTALIYGGGDTATSLSMFYNRWAWGVTFLILGTVLFPMRVNIAERWLPPLIIAAGMTALAMLKVTFFVPLVPVVLLILLAQKQAALAIQSVAIGLAFGGALLLWFGLDYFIAYFHDLLAVTSDVSGRSAPVDSFTQIIASPHSVLASLILLASIVLYRKSGKMLQGLVLLLLAPAFTYITYQNWGNDPKWLVLVILYLWVNLPERDERWVFNLPARQSILTIIIVAGTVIFPSVISLATSPIRAVFTSKEEFLKMPISEGVADIWLPEFRILHAMKRETIEGFPSPFSEDERVVINGFEFPECSSNESISPMATKIAQELEAIDFVRGKPVLAADILNVSWMFGDIERVQGAAPWYYGDTAGVENADYLMVPLCPINANMRRQMVMQFIEGSYGLNEVYRSNLFVLYEVSKPTE